MRTEGRRLSGAQVREDAIPGILRPRASRAELCRIPWRNRPQGGRVPCLLDQKPSFCAREP